MFGWLAYGKRIEMLEARAAELRQELLSLSERIDGSAGEAASIRDQIAAIVDETRRQDDKIDGLNDGFGELEKEVAGEARQSSMIRRAISTIEQRVTSIEDGIAAVEPVPSADVAIASLRTALARMEKQIHLQRADTAQIATSLLDRIEGSRRQR